MSLSRAVPRVEITEEEVKVYPNVVRNFVKLFLHTLLIAVFSIVTALYFYFTDFSNDIGLSSILVFGMSVIAIYASLVSYACISNIFTKRPRIVFTKKDIQFTLPFIKPFSIPLNNTSLILGRKGYPASLMITEWEEIIFFVTLPRNITSSSIRVFNFISKGYLTVGNLLKYTMNSSYPIVISDMYYCGKAESLLNILRENGFFSSNEQSVRVDFVEVDLTGP